MTNTLLLYSFRRCPYAMRARFTLTLCGIAYDQIEVDFKNKPKEMLERSPKGTVPVLVFKDTKQVIDESYDIMLWALKQKPEKLVINDAAKAMIPECETKFKYHLDRYKYHTRYENIDPAYHKAEAIKYLEKLEALLEKHTFLVSESPAIADVAIFPFIRQFSKTEPDAFQALPLPHLHKWLAHWLEHPVFKKIMV